MERSYFRYLRYQDIYFHVWLPLIQNQEFFSKKILIKRSFLLFKFKKIESSRCSICKAKDETYTHFLWVQWNSKLQLLLLLVSIRNFLPYSAIGFLVDNLEQNFLNNFLLIFLLIISIIIRFIISVINILNFFIVKSPFFSLGTIQSRQNNT